MKGDFRTLYLAEGQWKCVKSPTGAHHWIVTGHNMTCKHCSVHRDLSPKTAVPPS